MCLPGRSEAALAIKRAGGVVFGQSVKRRLYEDNVWPHCGWWGAEGRKEPSLRDRLVDEAAQRPGAHLAEEELEVMEAAALKEVDAHGLEVCEPVAALACDGAAISAAARAAAHALMRRTVLLDTILKRTWLTQARKRLDAQGPAPHALEMYPLVLQRMASVRLKEMWYMEARVNVECAALAYPLLCERLGEPHLFQDAAPDWKHGAWVAAALFLAQFEVRISLLVCNAANARPSAVDREVGIVLLSALCCPQDGTGGADEHLQFLRFANQIMRWRSEHLFTVHAPAIMSSRYCTMSAMQYLTTARRLLGGLGGGARPRSRRSADVEAWLRGLPLMEHQRCLVVVRHLERWGVVAGGGLDPSIRHGLPDTPMCIVPTLGPGHLLRALVGVDDPAFLAEVLSALRFVFGPALVGRLEEHMSSGAWVTTGDSPGCALAVCAPSMRLRFDPEVRGPLSHKDTEHLICDHLEFEPGGMCGCVGGAVEVPPQITAGLPCTNWQVSSWVR